MGMQVMEIEGHLRLRVSVYKGYAGRTENRGRKASLLPLLLLSLSLCFCLTVTQMYHDRASAHTLHAAIQLTNKYTASSERDKY